MPSLGKKLPPYELKFWRLENWRGGGGVQKLKEKGEESPFPTYPSLVTLVPNLTHPK